MHYALRRRARDAETAEEALDFTRRFRFGGVSIEPLQLGFEILQLLHVLERDPPGSVEIGTSLGGSFFLFTRVAAPDATLISLDLPGGTYGGGYFATRGRLLRSFARGRQRIELVRADSHDPKTLEHDTEEFRKPDRDAGKGIGLLRVR